MFLRLGGCNLACKWCDSAFTWDPKRFDLKKEIKWIENEVLVQNMLAMMDRVSTGLVVTGGEPLLQQPALTNVLLELKGWKRFWCEVETAGTVKPSKALALTVDQFNVSPKLAHSGNSLEKRFKPEVLKFFVYETNAYFKFVCQGVRDLEEVREIVALTHIPQSRVWIMPEGTDPEFLIGKANVLEPFVIEYGWNMTLRQHIILHGDRRGT